MRSGIGYCLLGIAAAIAVSNLYLSFVREPICRYRGRECRHVSGIPLLGNLSLIVALLILERTPLVWSLAITVIVLDTGGILWFVLTFVWMAFRWLVERNENERGNRMNIEFDPNDTALTADEFLALFARYWPHKLDRAMVAKAISRTTNVTARASGKLVACVRILSDDYMMSAICEVLIDPDYKNQDLARSLFELAYESAPTSLLLGVQSASPDFMQSLGWQPGPAAYYKRKSVPSGAP